MLNSTMMVEFLLMGFSDIEVRVLHALSFSLMYLVTLTGNFLIVIVTTLDKSLHTPMYFFLRNLSFLDACYTSVTVRNSCVNSLLDSSVISKAGCVAQVFLVVFFVYVELLFLTFMAYDCSVVICHPLHYPVIMNPQICVHMTLASVLSGLVNSGFHTGTPSGYPFVIANVIHQFFCDMPSLLKLSCSDTFCNEIINIASGLVIGGPSIIFIIRTYIHIFSTVVKFSSGEDREKDFATCIPHILVMSVFLSSSFYVYLRSSGISATIQDMVLSVFYSIIPPLFYLIIYSLRNEQINCAIRKIMKKNLFRKLLRFTRNY
ncbi:LOW QUALITY PROTEIN: olfactory receptor 14C36-like [Dugong dugon]